MESLLPAPTTCTTEWQFIQSMSGKYDIDLELLRISHPTPLTSATFITFLHAFPADGQPLVSAQVEEKKKNGTMVVTLQRGEKQQVLRLP